MDAFEFLDDDIWNISIMNVQKDVFHTKIKFNLSKACFYVIYLVNADGMRSSAGALRRAMD